jgi:hypothetical protein
LDHRCAGIRQAHRGGDSPSTAGDEDDFAEQLAALPWPLNKTTSVDKCATAFVKGIEGRKDRVYCPR